MTSQNAANGQSAMRPVLPIDQEIARLKEERNAIILAHNYTRGEVQDIADFLGDSLGLSRTAASTKADVIVFAAFISWPRPHPSCLRKSAFSCPTPIQAAPWPTW